MVLVDLITSDAYDATPAETGVVERGGAPPLQLNFMTDVPRVAGNLDFDDLSLSAAQWKLLAKVDGSSTLEEARLLAGLSAEDAERVVRSLLDAGILELHRRR